jgi:hypothetical protein
MSSETTRPNAADTITAWASEFSRMYATSSALKWKLIGVKYRPERCAAHATWR